MKKPPFRALQRVRHEETRKKTLKQTKTVGTRTLLPTATGCEFGNAKRLKTKKSEQL